MKISLGIKQLEEDPLIKLKDKKTFNKSDLEVFKALGLIIKWKAGKI